MIFYQNQSEINSLFHQVNSINFNGIDIKFKSVFNQIVDQVNSIKFNWINQIKTTIFYHNQSNITPSGRLILIESIKIQNQNLNKL